MQATVHIVNAFIDGTEGGNPAGVVIEADGLSTAEKLAVAAEVGLSETAFVSRSTTGAAFKLEFFTPTRQIAHCGHATIATFSLLRQLGKVGDGWTAKETIDGNRDIFIEDGMAFMGQLAPSYQDIAPEDPYYSRMLASLGLTPEQLLPSVNPSVVDTGNGFLVLPLKNESVVATLRPDFDAIAQISDALDLIGYYAFSTETRQAGRDAGARMLAPRYGIPEESATGMAAGPLACFLYDKLQKRKAVFVIEQGYLMNPPSHSVITVKLTVKDGTIHKLIAGGKAKPMHTIQLSF